MTQPIVLIALVTSLAFLLCFAFTPVVRRMAIRIGVIDKPDRVRKLQAVPIARLGGVAVFSAYMAAFGLVFLVPLGHWSDEYVHIVWRTAPALALIFITGLLDDIRSLTPAQKLTGQLIAALAAYAGGVRILTIGGADWSTWWSLPATLVWLILCTNAFNLIDGLDGLASGLGLLAAVAIGVAAVANGHMALAVAIAPLVGCLLAFLRYNFNPASIFLGDSGSLLIGFMLGCYGVVWSHKSIAWLGMSGPLIAVSIPLLDTALTVLRRFLRRRPIFYPDRGHIHHRLLDHGLTPRRAVILLYAFASAGAALSVLQDVIRRDLALWVPAIFMSAAIAAVYFLRVAELDAAGELFRAGVFRRVLYAYLELQRTQAEFSVSNNLIDTWQTICSSAGSFEFVYVRLTIGDAAFEQQFRDVDEKECWTINVAISGGSFILFRHNWPYVGPDMIGSYIDLVCKHLKAERFSAPVLALTRGVSA